jgi:hypothetical protein
VIAIGLVACASMMWAPSASADQCQWIDDGVASAAAKVLTDHHDAQTYCAPCGDKAAKPLKVAKAEVGQATMGGKPQPYRVVRVTDESGKVTEIDLAYTYVKLDPKSDVFTNLASIVSCPASGVPQTIGGSRK